MALWKKALETSLALNRSRDPTSLYVQLATLSEEGLAQVRTIVFRGFLPENPAQPDQKTTSHLTFVTDIRSQKVLELQHQSQVQLCWYFGMTREQFRLTGDMRVVCAPTAQQSLQLKESELSTYGPEEWELLRQTMWQRLSNQGRGGFAGEEPGKPLLNSPSHHEIRYPCENEEEKQLNEVALSRFCILVMEVNKVDHLTLKKPQTRVVHLFNKDGDWQSQAINP